MKKTTLFVVLLGLTNALFSAGNDSDVNKKYPVAELRQDYMILRTVLENVQPSLYRYTHKKVMDSFLDEQFSSIQQPMSELEFLAFLQGTTTRVGNGHSRIMPSDDYVEYSENYIKKFPFEIVIINQHAFIVENFTADSTITKGTEILSINGIPFNVIYAQISPVLPVDGYSRGFSHGKLAMDFAFHYSLYYPDLGSFDLELLPPGAKRPILKNVPGLLEQEIEKKTTLQDTEKNYFQLRFTDDSIAILKLENFWHKSFKPFIDNAFEQMARNNTRTLIIDLRDNRGGNDDNGVYLYSYISDKPFKYYSRMETRLGPNQQNIPCMEYVKNPETFKDIVTLITRDEQGRNVITYPDTTIGFVKPGKTHQPKPNHFDKDVYVLINGLSFSVTSDFCAIADYNNRAVFVGSETGGCYYGNTSGYSFNLVLPNTKLDVRLNLIEYLTAVENTRHPYGRGVLPDHYVYPSAMDINHDIDRELEYTLALTRMKK